MRMYLFSREKEAVLDKLKEEGLEPGLKTREAVDSTDGWGKEVPAKFDWKL